MKYTIEVLYQGALASYQIRHSLNQDIEANLISYKGEKRNTPRQYFYYDKQGRCGFASQEEKELMEAIYLIANRRITQASALAT